ncbi:Aromatic-L-amino-acid decarboxylase [Amphibalanus amphitrite]|uniref:Aromatic-L-amino-acid decarboxylase n=1 Tax=Amphibalanus amphitrite TaxID=1232801 RepID=A0A6A4WJK0_AMPAM|nr:Aromatic-L-amino-acid decarboxylase [Amphibalanus amphitrite]
MNGSTSRSQAEHSEKQTESSKVMDHEQFRQAGKEMIDYVADYLQNIRERRVLPTVQPGYLRALIPDEAPEEGESWREVMDDVERVIMPGVTHWHSPQFHAYFPTGNSYPAICADILSDAIGCIGFTWVRAVPSTHTTAHSFTSIASPACTELEVAMLDWLGRALALPEPFLASSGLGGGGVIQGTASEATLVALLSARSRRVRQLRQQHPDWTETAVTGQLVAYCSDQAHSSAERAGLLAGVRMRQLPTDSKFSLRGDTLAKAIQNDTARGLIPFFVSSRSIITTHSRGEYPNCAREINAPSQAPEKLAHHKYLVVVAKVSHLDHTSFSGGTLAEVRQHELKQTCDSSRKK